MGRFEFVVRRPLKTKQGQLLRKTSSGLIQIQASLAWPAFQLSDGPGAQPDVPCKALESSSVQPRANMDTNHNGQKWYAFELVSRAGSNEVFFAPNEADRQEWCFLLRKYAVHFDLANGYAMTAKVLGTGTYATVYLATENGTGGKVALKVIQKARLDQEEQGLLAEEVRISQEVTNQFCVQTREFIELEDRYVLAMEYVSGGELYDRLAHHRFPEEEVQHLFRQLLTGVGYLHSRNIVHRDLKPENFLCTADSPMSVKIADYGIAIDVSPSNPNTCLRDGAQLRCSPGYGAPEIANQTVYGKPCDMWSLGVVLILMLTGHQPFQGKTMEDTRAKMQKGDYDQNKLQSCSAIAADLVARLLEKNPANRITADAALKHAWIANVEKKV